MEENNSDSLLNRISFNHETVGNDHLEVWRDSLATLFQVEPDLSLPQVNDAYIDFYSLNSIVCIDQKFGAARFIRDHKKIAQYDNDIIGLCLWLDGSNNVDNAGVKISAKNSAFLMDFGKPINTSATASRCLSLAMPKTLLARYGLNINKLGGLSLSTDNPKFLILNSTLQSTFKALPSVKLTQAESISHALAAIVAGLFGHSENTLSKPILDKAICQTVEDYIQQNLANPKLDVSMIANALPFSRSNLYRKFSVRGGLANHIRKERLKRCYQAIGESTNQSLNVIDIAHSWGFTNGSHFSRLFRECFGISPTDLRDKVINDREKSSPHKTRYREVEEVNAWFTKI
jgi:AraC-like DNA-binding protein